MNSSTQINYTLYNHIITEHCTLSRHSVKEDRMKNNNNADIWCWLCSEPCKAPSTLTCLIRIAILYSGHSDSQTDSSKLRAGPCLLILLVCFTDWRYRNHLNIQLLGFRQSTDPGFITGGSSLYFSESHSLCHTFPGIR